MDKEWFLIKTSYHLTKICKACIQYIVMLK